jgi:hypothetical protein
MFKIKRIRGILSDKILNFFIERRINNPGVLRLFFRVYVLLTKGFYVRGHKDANHHFIPQFLLRKFRITNTGNIFMYTREKTPTPVSIKKEAAAIPNLYSFRDKKTKELSDFMENHIFARILEKHGSRIINRILKADKIELTHPAESLLASFIAFQYTRTPRFFFQLESVLTYLVKEKNVTLEEMVRPDFAKNVFIDNGYQLRPPEIAQFLQKTKLRITGVKDIMLRISAQIANDISMNIFSGELNLLCATGSEFFFLSDNPAEIFNFNKNRSIGPFFWEFNSNLLIYLPISPTRCIYYTHLINPVYPVISNGLIKDLSLKSIHEFAYSDRSSSIIDNALKQ